MTENGVSPLKECQHYQFLIQYWTYGQPQAYVAQARIPFRDRSSDWSEIIGPTEKCATREAAEKQILQLAKNWIHAYCKQNNIELKSGRN